MAVGYILIGWIIGMLSAVIGAIGYDMSLLAVFGLFVGSSVFFSFLSIFYTAWRTGCFDPCPSDIQQIPAMMDAR